MFQSDVAPPPHGSSKRHILGPGHAQTTPPADLLQWHDDLTEWSAKVDTEVSRIGSDLVTRSPYQLFVYGVGHALRHWYMTP